MSAFRDHLGEGERAGRRYALGLPRRTPRGPSGTALGQRAGSSLEFRDYREYQPGDDPRHIDWNAYARTDQLAVKLYREEITPHLDLVLDVSASMGLAGSAKGRAALALAALLTTAAANAGYSRAAWLAGDSVRPVPGGPRPAEWEEFAFDAPGGPALALASGPTSWRPRGVRVLVSDLLWLGEPLPPLRPLCEGAAAAAVIQLLAAADVNPPETGALRLVDAETGRQREIDVDAEVVRRYRDALARHQQSWHQACRQCGAIFTTVVAETFLQDGRLDDLVAAEFLRVV